MKEVDADNDIDIDEPAPAEESCSPAVSSTERSCKCTLADEGKPQIRRKGLHRFLVIIENVAGAIGLNLYLTDCAMLVMAVEAGAIQAWNEHAPSAHRVLYGDRIVEVNGVCGDAQLLLERLKDSSVRMFVQRPREVRIKIDKCKTGGMIGLEVDDAPDRSSLRVLGVSPGPVDAWNRTHSDLAIGRNDRMIKVNGLRRPAKELNHLIKTCQQMELVFLCYGESKPSSTNGGSVDEEAHQ